MILRAYIAAARNERYEPQKYGATRLKTNLDEPIYCDLCWDEPVKIAKLIHELFGYSAREQFARGIVEQPGWTANLLICADLRRAFGDLSDVPGFTREGNFRRDKFNDILMAEFDGRRIIGVKGYSSRILAQSAGEEVERNRRQLVARSLRFRIRP